MYKIKHFKVAILVRTIRRPKKYDMRANLPCSHRNSLQGLKSSISK